MDQERADPQAVEPKSRAQTTDDVADLVNGDCGISDHESHQAKGRNPTARPTSWKQLRKRRQELLPHRATGRWIPKHRERRGGDDQTDPETDELTGTRPLCRTRWKRGLPVEDWRQASGHRGGCHGRVSKPQPFNRIGRGRRCAWGSRAGEWMTSDHRASFRLTGRATREEPIDFAGLLAGGDLDRRPSGLGDSRKARSSP